MKFSELKKPVEVRYPKKPVIKQNYWTKKRCELLAQNYFHLSPTELRKMFGGYSNGSITRKANQLMSNGWNFSRPEPPKGTGRVCYVYKITDKNNGKQYIGVTINPHRRKMDHLNPNSNRNQNKGIAKAKAAGHEFDFEIVEYGSLPRMYKLEADLIRELNTLEPNGYNRKNGNEYYRAI